jgi:hypothetical protein
MPNTHLILHVKGTEQETTSLPKQVVRAAILQGEITHSQLIWSPEDNAWKQVRELPHLLPSQKLAPAPPPRLGTGALPKIEAVPQPQAVAVPRVAVKRSAQGPQARAVTARPVVAAVHDVENAPNEFNPFKWLCLVLGVAIVGALGFNYVMVDQPLATNLGKTSYGSAPVYAHLGAFMQPDVLLIHIRPSPQVTGANLSDFLSAVARSTPRSPVSDVLFDHVALTSGWTAEYGFSGSDWKRLGEMQKASEADREFFILEKITDAGGLPLISTRSSLSEEAQLAGHARVWASIVRTFTGR